MIEIIKELYEDRSKHFIYNYYPIKDIISTFLSIPIYTHYKEAVYLDSEIHFSGLNLTCDQIYDLEKHYDYLIFIVDGFIEKYLNLYYKEVNCCFDVVLEKWVGNTSVLLHITTITLDKKESS